MNAERLDPGKVIRARADATVMQLEWLNSHIDDDDGLPDDVKQFVESDLSALFDTRDALAGALREAVGRCPETAVEHGPLGPLKPRKLRRPCPKCHAALALLDRLGYGAEQ